MRTELLYNPRLLCERLGEFSTEKRRLDKLRGSVASDLTAGHVDSLELLELLRPLDLKVIYDVGANVGTWTLLAKALYPNSQIHAFEPLEFHAARFEMATRLLTDVTLHRMALGSVRNVLSMQVLDKSDASSLLPMTAECAQRYDLHKEGAVDVPVERLDDAIAAANIAAPDLIKLDVQGYELEALRGGEKALAGASAILTEVSFVELYEGQCLFHQLSGFLAEREFHLCALGAKTALGKPLMQADALYVRNSARPRLSK